MQPIESARGTAQAIVELTAAVADDPADETIFYRWRTAIHDADAAVLVEATARLSSDPGKRTRDIKALRESIVSEIERKNADRVIATMKSLDASATRLTWVSLALAVVGRLLAVLQVAQAFR